MSIVYLLRIIINQANNNNIYPDHDKLSKIIQNNYFYNDKLWGWKERIYKNINIYYNDKYILLTGGKKNSKLIKRFFDPSIKCDEYVVPVVFLSIKDLNENISKIKAQADPLDMKWTKEELLSKNIREKYIYYHIVKVLNNEDAFNLVSLFNINYNEFYAEWKKHDSLFIPIDNPKLANRCIWLESDKKAALSFLSNNDIKELYPADEKNFYKLKSLHPDDIQ